MNETTIVVRLYDLTIHLFVWNNPKYLTSISPNLERVSLLETMILGMIFTPKLIRLGLLIYEPRYDRGWVLWFIPKLIWWNLASVNSFTQLSPPMIIGGFHNCGIVRTSHFVSFLVQLYKGNSHLFPQFKTLNYFF